MPRPSLIATALLLAALLLGCNEVSQPTAPPLAGGMIRSSSSSSPGTLGLLPPTMQANTVLAARQLPATSTSLPATSIPLPASATPLPTSTPLPTTTPPPTIVPSSTGQLRAMLLDSSDLPAGFTLDVGRSGEVSNQQVASTEGNAELRMRTLDQWGRTAGYQAIYHRADPLLEGAGGQMSMVDSTIAAFASSEGAAASFADVVQRLKAAPTLPMQEVEDATHFGDHSALLCYKAGSGAMGCALLFQSSLLVARVTVVGANLQVQDVYPLATRLAAKIK